MPDLATYKNLIDARLNELGARLSDIETELDLPKSKDLGEQAVDLEDDEVLEGVGLVAQKETALLHDALGRIADGTYGTCQKCGDPISDARLRAVLYAVVCRDCAQAAST
ncbi:TraR/DksA family transcriptional regulator [uncultured Tateyamaria sp.]|uniref:TraR/DksA family transcriptional regulator n=1 Tax=uncultured Tateyamaria sp. TaxID=455651 RepID=UPI00262A71C4|nr:TraR/DksA family transcriptional regulator [uncultured Tateyamaria sp.]